MATHKGRVLMVSMLLHPTLQDAIRYTQTAFDLANAHAIFDDKADGLTLEVRIVLALFAHIHTSASP